jgi:uncharacterized protein YllA (UPF0747 family)
VSSNLLAAHQLYSRYVKGIEDSKIAINLWGKIPSTMGEAYGVLGKIRKEYTKPSPNLEILKKEMKRSLRERGLLTKRVSSNLDCLENGVIESGQQPMVLGGPSLILNKMAYSKSLCDLGKDNYIPVFYVADYDGVQAELTNIRVPCPSPRGLLITYPTDHVIDDAPIRKLPNPNFEWFEKTIEKIKSNYRGILKDVETSRTEKILINLDHAVSIIKHAYYSTENVSDLSTRILGSIVNIENDLGIPFIISSEPGIRELFQEGYERLLSEPNRTIFITESNKSSDILEKAGFLPQIGRRNKEYVPFYYECSSHGCQNKRVEMKFKKEGSNSIIWGKCQHCEQDYLFSYNILKPDISDIITRITPRVDSRQIIVDSVLPVLAHIGGPGETGYYAQIIPGIQKIDLPLPVFLRYTRTFYNTKWNELYEKQVKEQGRLTLLSEQLFIALNGWVEARNSKNPESMKKAHERIETLLQNTFNSLVKDIIKLQTEINEIKRNLSDPNKRNELIKEMIAKQKSLQEIELYLSSAFGRFSAEKFGQEVNWHWLDLALMSGLNDIMGVFLRQYNMNTPNSSMYFVNLT